MSAAGPHPRRNFSPWYQVVSRLMATEEADGLPDDPAGVRGVAGAVPGPSRAPRWRRGPTGSRSTWRSPRRWRATATDGRRIVFDTEDDMSVPAYLLVPDGRSAPGSAVLAVHGHGRASPVSAASTTPTAPRAVTTPPSWPAAATWCWPRTSAASASGPTGTPTDHYACDTNLVHQVMAGWNPLTQNLWDLGPGPRRLEAHPLVDPARMGVAGFSYGGTMTLFLAATDAPGGGRRGERVLLVLGRVAQGALEHVRLPGALRHAGPDGARGPGCPGGPAAPAGRVRSGRHALPGGHGGGRRWPAAAGLRPSPAPATDWSTTRSTASTSGTGMWPTRSSTAGWVDELALSGSAAQRLSGSAAQRLSGSTAPPSRGRGTRWRGGCAGGSRPGRTCRPGPPGRPGPAPALRASGTTARTRWARSRAGMVTVMAWAGTSASVGKCPSLTCWRRQPSSSVTTFTSSGSSKSATGGSLKARCPFSPIPRQHRSSGWSAQQRRVPCALRFRPGQAVEVVGGPRPGPGRRSGRGSSAGSWPDGRARRPRTRPCGRRRRPTRARTGRRTRSASTKASWELPVANMAWATPLRATARAQDRRRPVSAAASAMAAVEGSTDTSGGLMDAL